MVFGWSTMAMEGLVCSREQPTAGQFMGTDKHGNKQTFQYHDSAWPRGQGRVKRKYIYIFLIYKMKNLVSGGSVINEAKVV